HVLLPSPGVTDCNLSVAGFTLPPSVLTASGSRVCSQPRTVFGQRAAPLVTTASIACRRSRHCSAHDHVTPGHDFRQAHPAEYDGDEEDDGAGDEHRRVAEPFRDPDRHERRYGAGCGHDRVVEAEGAPYFVVVRVRGDQRTQG